MVGVLVAMTGLSSGLTRNKNLVKRKSLILLVRLKKFVRK